MKYNYNIYLGYYLRQEEIARELHISIVQLPDTLKNRKNIQCPINYDEYNVEMKY